MTLFSSICSVLDCVGVERVLGGIMFFLVESREWRWWHYLAWCSFILLVLELLSSLVMLYGRVRFNESQLIAHRGKHLDELSRLDLSFITFNKLTTTLFTMHLLRYAWYSDAVRWSVPQGAADWLLTAALFPALFVVYDFFYTLFHRALHLRGLYKHIHKHHHRQKAPSRGNVDAVNVHPFEFVSGEYNHLLACLIVGRLLAPVPAPMIIAFILIGGVLASLNHTRFDVKFPLFNGVYQVKFHDIHHWYPNSNYGQYLMFWDHIFGWFKPYPLTDKGVRKPTTTSKSSNEKTKLK